MDIPGLRAIFRSQGFKVVGLSLAILGIFELLFLARSYNYNLFHTITEGFSIIISVSIGLMVLNVRRHLRNGFLLVTGISFLFVAVLDFVHTIGFTGMNIFTGYGTNLTVQLWIAARLVQVLGLVLGIFFLNKKAPILPLGIGLTALCTLVLFLVFNHQVPVMYVEAQGLTDLKKTLEYLIILLFFITGAFLIRRKASFDPATIKLLVWAYGFMIISEFSFTLYVGPTDLFNMLGHFLKVIAFYLFYRALVRQGLQNPMDNLFHELSRLNQDLETTVEVRTEELKRTNSRLEKELEENQTAVQGLKIKDRIFNHSLDLLAIFGFDGYIKVANPAWEKTLGWSLNELLTRPSLEFVHPDDQEDTAKTRQSLLQGHSITEYENRYLSKDGTYRVISWNNFPYVDEKLVFAVGRDVTDKKETEQRLQRADKLESLGILAGGIAHDFNNLLSGLFGYIQLAQSRAESGKIDDALGQLKKAENVFVRAKDLASQLLTFSKGGAPILRVQSFEPLIKNAMELALSGTSVNVHIDCPKDLWLGNLDASQIGQVFCNLALNSSQAMNNKGLLTLTCRNIPRENDIPSDLSPGDYVKITVTDEGPGIPEDLLPNIFDPFFTTKDQGNGLGLAIVYSIMKKHGGFVESPPTSGTGAVFNLYFPGVKAQPSPSKLSAPGVFSGKGSILIMDDDTDIREVLSEQLCYLGFSVIETASGGDALEKAKLAVDAGKAPILAILDLTVRGGKGGFETGQELKIISPKTKTILSSGYNPKEVMAQALEYGFAGVLPKPYEVKDLVQILSEVLNDHR